MAVLELFEPSIGRASRADAPDDCPEIGAFFDVAWLTLALDDFLNLADVVRRVWEVIFEVDRECPTATIIGMAVRAIKSDAPADAIGTAKKTMSFQRVAVAAMHARLGLKHYPQVEELATVQCDVRNKMSHEAGILSWAAADV